MDLVMMKKKIASVCSCFGDVFVRFRRSDAGIMTEKRGKNSPKEESNSNVLYKSKMRQVIVLSLPNQRSRVCSLSRNVLQWRNWCKSARTRTRKKHIRYDKDWIAQREISWPYGGYPVADTQSGSVWFVILQENVEWTKWMIAFWEKHAIFVDVIKFDY